MNSNNINVFDNLVDAARQWPNNIAVFDEFGALAFSDLLIQVNQLKASLKTAGVKEGSSLAIIFKNNRHFIMALYGGLGCRCVVMPLAGYQKEGEIKKAVDDASIHFILSENKIEGFESSRSIRILNLEFLLYRTQSSDSFRVGQKFPGAAVMRFTSGTTADAKCVVLSHQTINERTQAANEGLQLTHDDRIVWVLPMAFHFVVSIMLYVRYGCGIITCNDFLAENIIKKTNAYKGTLLYASPMHIRLLAFAKEPHPLRSLKKVISTTAGISPGICQAFEEKYKIPVSQAFGIIEVGLPIINLKRSHENPEAVGFALPSFKIAIVDENQNGLPTNTIGNLAIQGPGIFDGYLKPYRTRTEVLKNGWFLTGDLASINEIGLIEIRGRTKDVINVSGNKVFPNEVEDVVNLYDGITGSRVYGKPHPLLGEMVVADVTVTEHVDLDIEKLIDFCRQFLSSYKIPQRILIVERIEMTGSGKVKRT